ncbi:MAG: tetratricopeptide repeat-containing sensor histidine kinase [Candidatus Cloacimonetes bacterium]|nr:tetratricopeptide repeat-containing sensor histidine kinase [Candidatus Cloacimonadota bacterium]MCF7814170.1 tetratricopeptide repeat-containing sensor histidine kinase [Candidatus Cloacimonadota bacterium]MCF7868767.1 tetratricopeptide repeat-containing sensor histidine kinase [Candidatus Cloacimonadota bacterium]MCF7884170.1 tetratricopeptide repeat-containing sensor histidine kinase [Candidatus Cloacimonadota bacterium]
MKKIFLVTLFFIVAYISAEVSVIDSLYTKLGNTDKDKYVDVLNRLAKEYSSINADSSYFYAELALQEAQRIDYPKGKINAFSNLGFYFFDSNHYDLALQYQKQSLELAQEIDYKEGIANALNNIGNIYDSQSNIDSALDYHLQALEINLQIGDENRIATSYNNIGNIYYTLSNYDKALEYYQKSLELKEKSSDEAKLAGAYSNIGNVYMAKEEFDTAIQYYEQALDLMQKISHQMGIAHFTNNLGIIYGNLKEFEKSLQYLHDAQTVYETIGDKRGNARVFYNIANLYKETGELQNALNFLENSLQIAQQINAQKIIQNCYYLYAEIYKKQENFKKAYENFEKYTTIKDSIFSSESSNKIAEMQVRFEMEKKEQENEIYRLELEKQKLVKWRLYFGLIILFVVTFLFYYRYKTKQKVNQELREKIAEALQKQKEQQQIIVHQANLSSLGEMAAGIAHEINQPLQNISLSAESIEIEMTEKKLDNKYLKQKLKFIYEDIERIKTISEHISTFSSEQKNEITKKFCLNESVQNAVSMIQKQFDKNGVDLKLKLKDDLSKIEGNVYKFEQVVLNLLSNAKDAVLEDDRIPEKTVTVHSNENEKEVFLEVEDNGIGISESVKMNIFLPFFTTKKFGDGTGLGLSIAYGIIKEMKGKIELVENNNTIFRVSFPKEVVETTNKNEQKKD